MLTLNNLSSPGANKQTKRLGRGMASGQGTQAGKGHKGQKARKSGHVRTGFEGGSMPLYMRLPKRGFSNYRFKTEYAIVNVGEIDRVFDGGEVTKDLLCDKGLISGADKNRPIKILGNGKMSKALSFVGIDKFTKGAADIITNAGGKINS